MLFIACRGRTLSGKSLHANAGFSLIELLVVIMIIGLGIQFATLNIGGNKQRETRQEAQEFVNAASLVAEEAVLTRRQWGVDFFRDVDERSERFGYRWLMRNEELQWQLAEETEDRAAEMLFSRGVKFRLEFDDVEQDIEPKRELPELIDEDEDISDIAREVKSFSLDTNETVEPHIWMLSSGEMTAFTLVIYDEQDPDSQIVIKGDELGRVNIEKAIIDDE